MVRLRECSSKSCEAVRQRLDRVIPSCKAWPNLRKWVLVAESCQLSVSVSDFQWLSDFTLDSAMILFNSFWGQKHYPDEENLAFDISEIFWFHRSQIQRHLRITRETLLDPLGRVAEEPPVILPNTNYDEKFFYRAGRTALTAAVALHICRKRLWDLVFMAQRKIADVSAVLEMVQSSSSPTAFAHKGHHDRSPEFCEFANENTTTKKQLHKCSTESCGLIEFPVSEAAKSILDGRNIAWRLSKSPRSDIKATLVNFEKPNKNNDVHISNTLAISHVWSDGTGAGVERPGMVNKCLVAFFSDLATNLGCSEVWWDTICVPMAETDLEKKARRVAISDVHENFVNARHVLIHDEYLLQIEWAEDGSPAVALVLSPWFSRGWTALELSVSHSVKILYRDPQNHSSYVMKDLFEDVLVQGPFGRLGHVAASTMIENLVGRPQTLMELITILSTRSTSWSRDRMAIAALLARTQDFDYNGSRPEITRRILRKYRSFPRSLLHHEQACLVEYGPFAWCPSNIFINPLELMRHWDSRALELTAHVELCPDSSEDGSILGCWYCTVLCENTVDEVKPVTIHLNVYKVLDQVPADNLVVLHSESAQLPDILVISTGLWFSEYNEKYYVDCHYVGCVTLFNNNDNHGVR